MELNKAFRITSRTQLRAYYAEPGEMVQNKDLEHIDKHGRSLIAVSPLVLIGTCDDRGQMDVSPKGDAPGFIHVLNDKQIAIPDRPGNKLLEGYQNLLSNPRVGLLFLIPGMTENYRVNGSGWISVEPELLARLAFNGRPALSAMIIEVEEAFMHCGKAALRSGLWQTNSYPDLSHLPTAGTMIADHCALKSAAEVDEDLRITYRDTLY